MDFLKKIFFPKENIAGLEIKDAVLRIARFQNGALEKASLILEPGVIDGGLIKNQRKFLEALKKLHSQFASLKDRIPAIAIIPSANVYTKVFNIPLLPQQSLEQAVKLNLESISPIEFSSAYADWQKVGEEERDGKVEILGAFSSRLVVDSYAAALEAAGFLPIAVEFSALAITRAISRYASEIDFAAPKVVVNLASDGIDFMVIKNGNLYFNYFVPWKLVPDEGTAQREIAFQDFQETLLREIKKVLTFYGSHWTGKMDQLILITQALNKEIADFIKQNFNLPVLELELRQFPDSPSSWYPVIGSAIRGTIERKEDKFISLMAVGTEKGYIYAQIRSFTGFWRKIIFTTLGFILILFIAADSFLARTYANLARQSQELTAIPAGKEVVELQEKAAVFNRLVEKVLIAKEKSKNWSDFFGKFNNLPKEIVISRLSVDASRSVGFLVGAAKDETSAINFKNRLMQQGLKNVSLPLSELKANPDSTISFSISFSF